MQHKWNIPPRMDEVAREEPLVEIASGNAPQRELTGRGGGMVRSKNSSIHCSLSPDLPVKPLPGAAFLE
jgi:hypothetical protein